MLSTGESPRSDRFMGKMLVAVKISLLHECVNTRIQGLKKSLDLINNYYFEVLLQFLLCLIPH